MSPISLIASCWKTDGLASSAGRLTCRRSPDYAQLAGNVHHATSHARPAVVSGQRFLREHLLDSGPGGEPASAVVDGVDMVELLGSRVVRALVVAQNAYSFRRQNQSTRACEKSL